MEIDKFIDDYFINQVERTTWHQNMTRASRERKLMSRRALLTLFKKHGCRVLTRKEIREMMKRGTDR